MSRRRRATIGEALYRLVLRLYPESFRAAHGEDMVELLRDLRRYETGRWSAMAVTLRSLAQLPSGLAAAWLEVVRHRHREEPELSRRHHFTKETRPMRRILDNLRYALRSWRRTPGLTAIAALTLALGVGANTAIFAVVYGVLLRPLALSEPHELYLLWQTPREGKGRATGTSPENLEDWRQQTTSFEAITAWVYESVTLWDEEEAEELHALAVRGNFFSVLGVEALHGRTLQADDERPRRRGEVVVISEGLWKRRWGGDPDLLGRTLTLDEEPHVVVGIVSSGIPLPPGGEIWIPQDFDPDDDRMIRALLPVARLRDGVTREQAQAEMERLSLLLGERYPEFADATVSLRPVLEALTGNSRPSLQLAAGAVGLVLLIACANLANLLLARATVREREMATRRALGASPRHILGEVLAESLVLGLLGGTFALAIAALGHRVVLATAPGILPRLDAVRLDLPVLVFAFGVSIAAGLFFGLAPLAHSARIDLGLALHAGARTSGGRRSLSRARTLLAIAQIAVAVTLLVGAGLLTRSLLSLRNVDPGFDVDGVVGARIYLDGRAYDSDEAEALYFEALVDRLEARAQITHAGASTGLPIDPTSHDFDVGYELPGQPTPAGEAPATADFRVATPGYFAAMGIALRAGRAFERGDTAASEPVMLVNATMADLVWPGERALGKELIIHFNGPHRRRVVGVVGDVRFRGLDSEYRPEMFLPQAQAPFSAMSVVVRGRAGPAALLEQLRQETLAVDRRQPVHSTFTLRELVAASLARDRFYTRLLALFAGIAALLATAGLYGVIAYWVSQSRKEIGVRLALGAARRQVMALVLRRSLGVTFVGLVLGLGGALLSRRLLGSMLHGVDAHDPVVLVAVTLLLGGVALLASYVPARQASRLDPVATLRVD